MHLKCRLKQVLRCWGDQLWNVTALGHPALVCSFPWPPLPVTIHRICVISLLSALWPPHDTVSKCSHVSQWSLSLSLSLLFSPSLSLTFQFPFTFSPISSAAGDCHWSVGLWRRVCFDWQHLGSGRALLQCEIWLHRCRVSPVSVLWISAGVRSSYEKRHKSGLDVCWE